MGVVGFAVVIAVGTIAAAEVGLVMVVVAAEAVVAVAAAVCEGWRRGWCWSGVQMPCYPYIWLYPEIKHHLV